LWTAVGGRYSHCAPSTQTVMGAHTRLAKFVGADVWYDPVRHAVCGIHTRSESSRAELGGSYSLAPHTVRLLHMASASEVHAVEMYSESAHCRQLVHTLF
jgi:hypothetical protein